MVHGSALWTVPSNDSGGGDSGQPTSNKGSNSNSVGGRRNTKAHAAANGSASGGAFRGRAVQGTQSCEAEALRNMDSVRRGAAGSAVNLGSQLFRKATAGSSYLKGHTLGGGHGVSSRSIPPVQGEQHQVKEGATTAGGEGGTGTLLVPLFKPDHTQDGPACACLQALEPYAVLCCSAGAYAGNYFFISKDPPGEILGGGPQVVPSAVAMPAESTGQREPQHQEEADVRHAMRRENSSEEENSAVNCLGGPLQGQEHHMAAPSEATAASDITVSQQQRVVQQRPPAEQQEVEKQLQQVEEQPKAQACWQADSQERPKANPVSRFDEPAEVAVEAGSHQQAEARQQGLPSCDPRAEAEQPDHEDKVQRRHRPQQVELPQVYTVQRLETGHSTAEEGADPQQQREGTEEQRDVGAKSLVEKQRTTCHASEQQVEGFELDDVTMRIEHAGLSAVHARIWEDPERKHLEDRLNIEDLASEEGTWKKVRWDRPIPVCRCSGSPRSTLSFGSDATSVASDTLTDDQENQRGTGEDGGEEAVEVTGRVDEVAVQVPEASEIRANVLTEETAGPTVMESEVEGQDAHTGGGRKGETAESRDQQQSQMATLIGTLSCHSAVSEDGRHTDADWQRHAGTPSTQTALASGQHMTESRVESHVQRGQLRRSQSAKPASPEGRQSRHLRRPHDMQKDETLAGGQPEQGQDPLALQQHAEQQQSNSIHQECAERHVGLGSQRSPTKERRYEEGLNPVRKVEERLKKRRSSSCQLVNFSGRLLRFERGSPLSPSEAFDEFLLTFELQHLKSRLLACLRQRGCCCTRVRRTRREATSTSGSISQPRGIGTPARADGLQAAAPRSTREDVTGAITAKATEAPDREGMRGPSPGFAGDIKAGFATVPASGLADREASHRREGFHQWNRLTAFNRMRRDCVHPMHTAAAHSSEDCSSRRERTRRLGMRRWASLASARSRDFVGVHGASTKCLCSAEDVSDADQQSKEAAESTDNILRRDAVRGDEDDGGKQREADCDYFRSSVTTLKNERPARSYSRGTWWRSSVGAVAACGRGDTKRKGNAALETNRPKAACKWEREQSCWRCSRCEANPLRWLWRTGPLSLLCQDESSGELRGRTEAGDEEMSGSEVDATTTEAGTPTKGTPVAAGATGGGRRYEASSSGDRHARQRPSFFSGTFTSQRREKYNRLQTSNNTQHTPFCLLLTPGEADRWRMACVELPRHFLPVSKRSRPLTIYDEATGSKLGEVRWSGCCLVSQQHAHVRVDRGGKATSCTRRAAPEVEAATVTTAPAAAALQQPTGCSPKADAEQHNQQRQGQLETPLLCQLQEEQAQLQETHKQRCGQPQLASTVHNHDQVTTEHPDGRSLFSELSGRSSGRDSGGAKAAADLMTHMNSVGGNPSSQADRAAAAFLGTSSAMQTSRCVSLGRTECRLLDHQAEVKAVCDDSTRAGIGSNRTDLLCSTVSSTRTVNMPVNMELVLEFPTATVSAAEASERASPGNASGPDRTSRSGEGSRTGPRYNDDTADVKSSSRNAPPFLSRASGSQGRTSSVGPQWRSGADPLKDCDCWLVSSVATQDERRPHPAAFASSPRKSKKDAGLTADSCVAQGKKPLSGSCPAVPARDARGGTAASNRLIRVAGSQGGGEPPTGILTRAVEEGAPPAPSPETARASSSETATRRPSAAAAAAARRQRTSRAGLHRTAPQWQGQNTEDSTTHGEDAPVEAVAQRLRTSSVSLLLRGRFVKRAVRGRMRTERRSVNSSSSTEVRKFRETVSSPATSRKTENMVVCRVSYSVGIQSPASGAEKHFETPQHDYTAQQSQSAGEAQPGLNYQQQCESEGHQHVDTGRFVEGFTEEPLPLFRSPKSSSAADATPGTPVRQGGSAQDTRRRWSVGIDGLLHWTSSRRHRSSSQEKSDSKCIDRTGTLKLPSASSPPCVSSPGRSLSVSHTHSGSTNTASVGSRSKTDIVGETTSGLSDSDMPPRGSMIVREYPLFGTPEEQLRTPGGLPFSSSSTLHLYSSARTIRSPLVAPAFQCGLSDHSFDRAESTQMSNRRVTGGNSDVTAGCPTTLNTGSNFQGPRRATTRRRSLAAAAAPVFAVVRSAAAAMAAVAPGVFTAGAVSGSRAASSSAVHAAPVRPSCVAVETYAAGSSPAALTFDSLCAERPLLDVTPQPAESVKDAGTESAIPTISSGEGTSSSAACATAPCRAVAVRSPEDDTREIATVSAAADTFLKISTESLRSAAREGIAYGAFSHVRAELFDSDNVGSSAADMSATTPAVNRCTNTPVLYSKSSTVSTSATASDVVHPAFMCQHPVHGRTPVVGATVAGAIRSSIRRRRSSFCKREGNTCHFPLLAPARGASCLSSHFFSVKTSHPPRDAPNPSAPAADVAAPWPTQQPRGVSVPRGRDVLQVSTRSDAPGKEVAAPAARSTALLRAVASASTELTVATTDSPDLPVPTREHGISHGISDVKQPAQDSRAFEHSVSTELRPESTAIQGESKGTESPHKNSGVHLVYHSEFESAAPGEHSVACKPSGTTGGKLDEREDIVYRGEGELHRSNSRDGYYSGTVQESFSHRAKPSSSVLVEGTTRTKSLNVEERTGRLPSERSVRCLTSDCPALTQAQQTHAGQCVVQTHISGSADERNCRVQLSHSVNEAGFCAAQMPVVEGEFVVRDWRAKESVMKEVKVPGSCETASDVVACASHERASSPCHSGVPSGSPVTASVGCCSVNLARPPVGADTLNGPAGGKQEVLACRTSRTDQAASFYDGGAGTVLESPSLSVVQQHCRRELHACALDEEDGEAAGQLKQCENAFSSSVFTAQGPKDLQHGWSARRVSLVREARHRTSPEAFSSDSSDCSGVEDQERDEVKRGISTDITSGVRAVEYDEQTGGNQTQRCLDDTSPHAKKVIISADPASVSLSGVPRCAADSHTAGSIATLHEGYARPVSQPVSGPDKEEPVQPVQLLEDSGRQQTQDFLHELQPLRVPVANLRTARSEQLSTEGSPFARETSNQREPGSPAAKPTPLMPQVNVPGQTRSSEGEEGLFVAYHQVDKGGAVRGNADTEGVSEHEELRLPPKLDINNGMRAAFISTSQNCSEDLRDEQSSQLQQERGCHAEKTIVHTGDRSLDSDSSMRGEGGDKTSTEKDIIADRCSVQHILFPTGGSGETDLTLGTPKAKGELKCMLFSLGDGSKVKTGPTSPSQGWRTYENRSAHTEEETASAAAAGHASPFAFVEGNYTELDRENVSRKRTMRAGDRLATPHRLQPRPTSAREGNSEKNTDASRSQHPALTYATRMLLSFVVRPSTPSAGPREGDDRVSMRLKESVSVAGGNASPTAMSSNTRYSGQQPALDSTEDGVADATRVACSASLRQKDAATVKRRGSFQESLEMNCEGKGQEGALASLCGDVAERCQHMDLSGRLLQEPEGTNKTPEEGSVACVMAVNSCTSSSQEEAKGGYLVESFIHSDGDSMRECHADTAAEDASVNVKQTCAPQPCEVKRGWVKRTEGRCSGALNTLQLAAAAQYVATRKKVAARLTRKQSSGTEEMSSGTVAETEPDGGRRPTVDEAASVKKRGGRVKLFPYRKCEGKKGDTGHYREEGLMMRRVDPISERSHKCSSERYCSSSQARRDNQKRHVSGLADTRGKKHEQKYESQEDGPDNKSVVKRGAAVGKVNHLSSGKSCVPRQENEERAEVNDVLERSASARTAESAEEEEESSAVLTGPRIVHENEVRLLLQAQAYLLRQEPRRQDFPEVVIPAAADDEQHMPGPPREAEKTMSMSRETARHCCRGTKSGREIIVRTIKPCYAYSPATEHCRGFSQNRAACSVPSPQSPTSQHTPCDGLQDCEAVSERKIVPKSCALERSSRVGEANGEYAGGEVCETAHDKWSKKVLCVYAGGEFQLLLAEPDDEEGEGCASGSAAGAVRASGASNRNMPSCHWRTCSCWVRLQAKQHYRLRPGDVLRVGPLLEFSLKRFLTGVASQQGYRLTMEDEEVAIQDLGVAEDVYCSFFAVYDGHGGRSCAEFVKRVLHVTFRRELLRMCGGSLSVSSTVRQHVYQALLKSFLTTDAAFLGEQQRRKRTGLLSTSGCACVVVVILGGEVWCANCGDARAVLCRGGKALELSSDHKPHRKDELQRIVAAGGFVRSKRVLGRLAVSRAFGDVDYKGSRGHCGAEPANMLAPASADAPVPLSSCTIASGHEGPEGSAGAQFNPSQRSFDVSRPLVTAVPEIRMQPLCEEDEFLLLACDGLFDVFTSQEAADFVRDALNRRLADFRDPQALVDALLYEAIEKRRSRDNVTAILVLFSPSGRIPAIATSRTRRGDLPTKELE